MAAETYSLLRIRGISRVRRLWGCGRRPSGGQHPLERPGQFHDQCDADQDRDSRHGRQTELHAIDKETTQGERAQDSRIEKDGQEYRRDDDEQLDGSIQHPPLSEKSTSA